MIAILYALREELKPFLQSLQKESPLFLVRTGIGLKRAAEATRRLLESHHPSLVLSVGYAGGLQPKFQRGDLIVAESVSDESGRLIEIPLSPLKDLSFHTGKLISVKKALVNLEQKRQAGEKGFAAVDMESFAEATLCHQRKIPFLSLRVIFDPLEEALGPKLFLKIPKVMRTNRLCQKRLHEALSLLIPKLANQGDA